MWGTLMNSLEVNGTGAQLGVFGGHFTGYEKKKTGFGLNMGGHLYGQLQPYVNTNQGGEELGFSALTKRKKKTDGSLGPVETCHGRGGDRGTYYEREK